MKRVFLVCAVGLAVGLAACGGQGRRGGAFRAACGADLKQFCSGVDRDGIRDCMQQHADQLSQSCRSFIAARQAAMGASAAPTPSGAPAASAAPASSAQ